MARPNDNLILEQATGRGWKIETQKYADGRWACTLHVPRGKGRYLGHGVTEAEAILDAVGNVFWGAAEHQAMNQV